MAKPEQQSTNPESRRFKNVAELREYEYAHRFAHVNLNVIA